MPIFSHFLSFYSKKTRFEFVFKLLVLIFQLRGAIVNIGRIDSKKAKEVRLKIYKFLGGYLNPPKPLNTIKDLQKVAYRY